MISLSPLSCVVQKYEGDDPTSYVNPRVNPNNTLAIRQWDTG